MVDPEKWANHVETRRKQSAEAKNKQQEAFVARQKVFKEEAPKLWSKVRDAFDKFCEAYNKHRDILYRADIGPNTFVVRRTDAPMVMIEVSLLSGHRLSVISDIRKYNAMYEPEVFENKTLSYVVGGAPITLEQIAASALDSFVQF